jgi:hypothetical protein
MRLAPGALLVQAYGLGVELHAQVVDLGDELVDPLGDILAALVGLEDLAVELANAPLLRVDRDAKLRDLAFQATVPARSRPARVGPGRTPFAASRK